MKNSYKKSHRLVFWAIFFVLIITSCFAVAFFWTSNIHAPTLNEVSNYYFPKITSARSNSLFLGNIYWGRYINDWSMASDLKYAYPFSRLNEFNRENYDAWISTLECPTVYGVSMTSAEEDATLTFNCSPDYLPEVSKWFDVLSLSSNHTDNQGLDGFEETKEHLEENNIQYFGSHNPENIEDACEIVSLPMQITYDDTRKVTEKFPIALCGYQGVFGIPPQEAIDQIAIYSKYMPTIAMPHMGAEYVYEPDGIKTNTYHAMIDAGADLVIGDHPHTYQTSEVYNGKPIIYSMGNFIFDQQGYSDLTLSAGVNVLIEVNDIDAKVMNKWLEIGQTCSSFKDNCLEQIIGQNLEKLDFSYSLGIIGASDDKKIAKPATQAELDLILSRLNWQDTLSKLRSPYSGL